MDTSADLVNSNCSCGYPKWIEVGSAFAYIAFAMSLLNLGLHMVRRRSSHPSSRV